jgi:hypothetical protein
MWKPEHLTTLRAPTALPFIMSKMFSFEVFVKLSIKVEFTSYRVWGHIEDEQEILNSLQGHTGHSPPQFWIMELQQGSIIDVMTECTHCNIQ